MVAEKKFKVDITDSNIGIDSTGSLATPISHEHNSDVVMDGILSDIESVALSDDTELDDNKSFPFSFDSDNYILDSSGIDTNLEEFIISSVNLQCTCGTDKFSHHRSCPLKPRNKGKPAEKSDVEVITSEDAKPLVIGKTPSIGWMNSAALLMQEYTSESVRAGTDTLMSAMKSKEITFFTELLLY